MKISISESNLNSLFIGDENGFFEINYGGSDFYWIVEDYEKQNKFVISKNDKDLYLIFADLFEKIAKSDNKYSPSIKNNVFEWISEARLTKISNKLLITKNENEFIIEFIKNPMDYDGCKMCAICFCLSGSRNQKIVFDIVMMYQNYIRSIKEKVSYQKNYKK